MTKLSPELADGAATLLLNAQAVGIIRNPDLSVAEKARLISPEDLALLLHCCESEDYILQELLQTLGKLLIERENLGGVATVSMAEILSFSGKLNTLIGGLWCCVAEIRLQAHAINLYHASTIKN
jgi:hypothetical protein